jgi:hypothetical protein
MFGPESTVKLTALLATPDSVTTTFPVAAAVGTGTTTLVGPQLVGKAIVPLNVIVVEPWVGPKFVPVMVIEEPTEPELGDRLVMRGVGRNVKLTVLLAFPAAVTTTGPELAPLGTGTVICESVQLAGVAAAPLKVTVLEPWVRPKVVPAIVTVVPDGAEEGERLVMFGTTVKFTLLLGIPPALTTRGPVDAPAGIGTTIWVLLQLAGVAAVPLKVTFPAVEPK